MPAGAANLWDKWAALTPTVGVWVVVPAVLFFVAAVVSLCRGLKKLFAAAKPSPLEALKLWAPLLVSYVGSGVEQLFHIRNGFFTPVLTYGSSRDEHHQLGGHAPRRLRRCLRGAALPGRDRVAHLRV